MKIKPTPEFIEGRGFMSDLIMSTIHQTKWFEEFVKRAPFQSEEERLNESFDLDIRINGESIDPQAFFNHVDSQYNEIIKTVATKMLEEKVFSDEFADLIHKIEEAREVLTYALNQASWDNIDTISNNVFKKQVNENK